jgi:hypothetical protein
MIKCPNCLKLRRYIIPSITQIQHPATIENGLVEDMLKEVVIKNICVKCLIDAEKIGT